MQTATKILNDIVQLIYRQKGKDFNFDTNLYQFKYRGNIRSEKDLDKLQTNPSIVIYGEDVDEFNNLYKKLYETLGVDKKLVSFGQFKSDSLDLLFFNPTIDQFKEIILTKYGKPETFYYVAPIYGIFCKDNTLDFGAISFVSKEHITEYIKNVSSKNDVFLNFTNNHCKENIMYLVKKYTCFDANYTQKRFILELDQIINILRFLTMYKTDRSYIDRAKTDPRIIHSFAFSKDSGSGNASMINMNDIPVIIDKLCFGKEYIKKIFEIFCKENKTDLEHRIIRSLVWCGRSIEEFYLDLSCAEIAFAFESILKNDKCSLITQSIQDQIAESTALILYDDYEQITKQIKELKEFYSLRSAIAHGTKQNGDASVYIANLKTFRKLIIRLLEDNSFLSCTSLNDVKGILDKKKYTCKC